MKKVACGSSLSFLRATTQRRLSCTRIPLSSSRSSGSRIRFEESSATTTATTAPAEDRRRRTTTWTRRWYCCGDDDDDYRATTTGGGGSVSSSSIRKQQQQQQRQLSSLTTAAAVDDEEEEPDRLSSEDEVVDIEQHRQQQQRRLNGYHHHSYRRGIQQQQQQQPRLEALRRRLRREEEEEASAAAAVSVSRWTSIPRRTEGINSNRTTPATTTSSSSGGCLTNNTTTAATPDDGDDDDDGGGGEDAASTERLLRLVERLPDPPPPPSEEENTSSSAVLTDTYGRFHDYLRISLTERCNLRCTYCMPADGVPLQPPDNLLTTPEILELAGYFVDRGVRKFRLTGGEPTLRKDLVNVVEGLSALRPAELGMTTNGVHFAKLGPDLVDAGLTAVNISLDTIDPTKFEKLTRRPGAATLERVMAGLETALQYLPPHKIKINCVVMRGTNDDAESLGDFVRLQRDHFPGIAVRFIEYMPFSSNGWNWDLFVPYQEMLETLEKGGEEGVHLIRIPSADPNDTTKWYTTDREEDDNNNTNKIGFITSMSSHFCATCNRIRLTADGRIKVCLFDGGSSEISLRDILRHHHSTIDANDDAAIATTSRRDGALDKIIYHALRRKHFKLGGHVDAQDISDHSRENRPMTLIGG